MDYRERKPIDEIGNLLAEKLIHYSILFHYYHYTLLLHSYTLLYSFYFFRNAKSIVGASSALISVCNDVFATRIYSFRRNHDSVL